MAWKNMTKYYGQGFGPTASSPERPWVYQEEQGPLTGDPFGLSFQPDDQYQPGSFFQPVQPQPMGTKPNAGFESVPQEPFHYQPEPYIQQVPRGVREPMFTGPIPNWFRRRSSNEDTRASQDAYDYRRERERENLQRLNRPAGPEPDQPTPPASGAAANDDVSFTDPNASPSRRLAAFQQMTPEEQRAAQEWLRNNTSARDREVEEWRILGISAQNYAGQDVGTRAFYGQPQADRSREIVLGGVDPRTGEALSGEDARGLADIRQMYFDDVRQARDQGQPLGQEYMTRTGVRATDLGSSGMQTGSPEASAHQRSLDMYGPARSPTAGERRGMHGGLAQDRTAGAKRERAQARKEQRQLEHEWRKFERGSLSQERIAGLHANIARRQEEARTEKEKRDADRKMTEFFTKAGFNHELAKDLALAKERLRAAAGDENAIRGIATDITSQIATDITSRKLSRRALQKRLDALEELSPRLRQAVERQIGLSQEA